MSKNVSVLLVVAIIGGTLGALAIGMWLTSGATGTVDICKSEDPASTNAIMLTVTDVYSRSREVTSRALFAIDIRTGKTGNSYDAGESSRCLGGLGPNAVLYTTKDGIHVRDVVTGAIAKTEKDLLGDLSKSKASWWYDSRSHRLTVRTKFDDEYVVDLATHEQWPISKAPEVKPSTATTDLVRLEFESQFASRQGQAHGSSYVLACEGSRCKLATCAMNAYGNTMGVDPTKKPLENADEILVAKIEMYFPGDDGILVSALATLDESSGELVRMGLDGKVKWRSPIKATGIDGYVAGDVLVVGHLSPISETTAQRDRFYSNHDVDVWLVGKEDGKIRANVHVPQRTVISRDLADIVARFGDTLVIATHGEAVALSSQGGAPLWRKRF